jgi:hypothetical protein
MSAEMAAEMARENEALRQRVAADQDKLTGLATMVGAGRGRRGHSPPPFSRIHRGSPYERGAGCGGMTQRPRPGRRH